MHDLALIAAQQWAQAHVSRQSDPVEFGADVARAYLSAQSVVRHAGDEAATAVALAALSIPDETLQALALISSQLRRSPAGTSRERLPDVAGAGV